MQHSSTKLFRTDLHFLVVNDTFPMRQVVMHLLKELGYLKISEAIDGAMAMRTFKHAQLVGAPIGFVITDCAMPVMDGLELIRTIRSTPALTAIPVLMVTPEASKENILAAVEAGTDGYIVRPFNAAALRRKIEKILEAKKG
jgi:two-component system chemotaxis response regulator CheY